MRDQHMAETVPEIEQFRRGRRFRLGEGRLELLEQFVDAGMMVAQLLSE
jgi:hypothetical protein